MQGFYGGTMNVEIRGSGDDYLQSQGLCGLMTGQCRKDLLIRGGGCEVANSNCRSWQHHKQFSESWRYNIKNTLTYI